jgi:glycosyltransferase involved in cell wall biosynthesis
MISMKLDAIGIYIICYNEEKRIKQVLESVKWADEIIIVDSLSDDKTLEISSHYTDKIYKKEFTGFGEQKNYALSLVSKEWAFNIDADEVVTDELKEEIAYIEESENVNGYFVPRLNYYLGKPVKRCGWYPDYKLRLHRRDAGNWQDVLVHESFHVQGKAGYLYNNLLHYTYDTIKAHMERICKYAVYGAEMFARKGKKVSACQLIAIPIMVFLKKYIVQLGFMEGYRGILISFFESYYSFLKYALAYDKMHSRILEEK